MTTLADIYTNQAGLRDELRAAVGYPNDSVLTPDASVDGVFIRALRRLNDMIPLLGIGVFPTVADQQVYSPLAGTGCRLRKAWWPNGSDVGISCSSDLLLMASALGPFFGPVIDQMGTKTLLEPAQILAVKRQWAWLRKLTEVAAQVIENEVYLVPIPGADGIDVYFTYDTDRYATSLEVDVCWATAFWAAAESEMHRRLAAGAGGVDSLTDPVTGSRITLASPKHHLTLTKQADERFSREFSHPTYGGGWP